MEQTHSSAGINPVAEHNYHPIMPWVVVISAALFFFYEFVQMSMFNAINPYLTVAFNVKAAQLGNLSAAYFYSDVLFLLPAGMILDRFSPKKVIVAAMALCIASTYLFASAEHFWIAMAARFMTGMGSAFCLLSCLKLASRWFPPRRLALVTGIVVTMAMIGGMIAQTPFTILTASIGWREGLVVNASMGVLLLLVIVFCVRDYPPGMKDHFQAIESQNEDAPFWQGLVAALKNPQAWFGGLFTSLLNLPIFLLGQTFGAMFLMQIHGLSHTQATNVTMMIFLGTIIGSPIIGWFSDRIGRRKMPMILGAIFSLISFLIIMLDHSLSYESLMTIFFMIGFFTASQIVGYPLIAESSNKAVTATSLSLASVLIMSGGMLEPFYGWILQSGWDGLSKHGIPIYTAEHFFNANLIMPIAFILGLACAFLARETYCKHKSQRS